MDAVPTGDTELSLSRLRSHASVTGSSVITVSNNVTRGVRWKGEVGGEVGVPCNQPATGVTSRVNDPIAINVATKRAVLP